LPRHYCCRHYCHALPAPFFFARDSAYCYSFCRAAACLPPFADIMPPMLRWFAHLKHARRRRRSAAFLHNAGFAAVLPCCHYFLPRDAAATARRRRHARADCQAFFAPPCQRQPPPDADTPSAYLLSRRMPRAAVYARFAADATRAEHARHDADARLMRCWRTAPPRRASSAMFAAIAFAHCEQQRRSRQRAFFDAVTPAADFACRRVFVYADDAMPRHAAPFCFACCWRVPFTDSRCPFSAARIAFTPRPVILTMLHAAAHAFSRRCLTQNAEPPPSMRRQPVPRSCRRLPLSPDAAAR